MQGKQPEVTQPLRSAPVSFVQSHVIATWVASPTHVYYLLESKEGKSRCQQGLCAFWRLLLSSFGRLFVSPSGRPLPTFRASSGSFLTALPWFRLLLTTAWKDPVFKHRCD